MLIQTMNKVHGRRVQLRYMSGVSGATADGALHGGIYLAGNCSLHKGIGLMCSFRKFKGRIQVLVHDITHNTEINAN